MSLSPHLTKMRNEGQKDIAAVIEEAELTADEFLCPFYGVMFDHSMFSSFSDREKLLPWEGKYPKNTAKNIELIAAKQQSWSFDSNTWWKRFYNPDEDSKLLAQELAVSGLLVLDQFLTEVAYRGNLWRAMRYQSCLQSRVIMLHAFIRERFFRSQSDIAVVAANARHAENRAMKQEVWNWYEANEQCYRSMDAAAEAIAGKIAPITFRTARKWIGEHRKKNPSIHSARRE